MSILRPHHAPARARHLVALAAIMATLAGPFVLVAPAAACGNSGADVEARADQAITWASSLLEWHARRRVATAGPDDVGVVALHGAAEAELVAAVESFSSGRFDAALDHAETVEALLDN